MERVWVSGCEGRGVSKMEKKLASGAWTSYKRNLHPATNNGIDAKARGFHFGFRVIIPRKKGIWLKLLHSFCSR